MYDPTNMNNSHLDQQLPSLAGQNELNHSIPEAQNHMEGLVEAEHEIKKSPRDEAEMRCKAEELVLYRRRREAEASARIVAAQKLAAQGLQKQNEVDDVNSLKQALVVSVSCNVKHCEN